ncbi:hypothetical protein J5834_02270 [bacterium]|nr:hypothetical protein [bacterium]
MKALRTILLLIVPCCFIWGCSGSGNSYFFENPVDVTTVGNVVCKNGSVSYIAFVTDNTKKYGARLMEISGCGRKIDKKFKDERDKKTGVYIGGVGVKSDLFIKGGEAYIAVASSGYVVSDHWKDEKEEEKRLPQHKGRIALRRLTNQVAHEPDSNRSFTLDFYPENVKAYLNEGFFFSGSDLGKRFIGFVTPEGEGVVKEITFDVSDIVVVSSRILVFDRNDGSVYTVTKELETEKVRTYDKFVSGRMSGIFDKRIVFFKGRELEIYSPSLELLNSLEAPDGFDISAVTDLVYTESYNYRLMKSETMSERVEIYHNDETSDDDEPEESGETLTDGIDYENWETSDAVSGNVILVSSANGLIMAYDFETSAWLAQPYDASEKSNDYARQLRPYMNSRYAFYPQSEDADSENGAVLYSVEASRGTPFATTYRFVYEGIFEGSSSPSGVYDASENTITDERADFTVFGIDPETDSVVLTSRVRSDECGIPENTSVTMQIASVDGQVLHLAAGEYSSEIANCFGETLGYAIFAKERYAVSRETNAGRLFLGRGSELGAGETGFSYEDDYVGVAIRRRDDAVATEKETSFYFKINPGIPYVGISSSDIMNVMSNPAPMRFVAFSTLTRRVIEYDLSDNSVVKVYK